MNVTKPGFPLTSRGRLLIIDIDDINFAENLNDLG
jgi:hypothetical protein